MHIDLSTLSPASVYATMTQTLVPRPIAWIVSRDEHDGLNLAPFSYFTAVASDPPTIVVSIGLHADDRPKDTRRNIEARHEFTINIAHREQAQAMTATSASLAPGESELDAADLATAPMPGGSVPRLADCRVAYACRYESTHRIGRQAVIFARLTDVWLHDSVVTEDAKGRLKVDAVALDPLGRLGGGEYVAAGDIIDVPRPA